MRMCLEIWKNVKYSWSRKAATRGGEKWGSRGEETMSGEYTQRRKRRCTDTTTPLVYYILYIPMRMRCWGQQVTVAPYDECRPRFQSLVRSFYPSVYMHVHKHTHTHIIRRRLVRDIWLLFEWFRYVYYYYYYYYYVALPFGFVFVFLSSSPLSEFSVPILP